ncbi:zinc finger BED domain-containing protein 4-like [Hydra vulgaris]|uniref:Zinc finger BED domain-containing protein 4-like n=1 Tax=Hydra vulgaris TaxID=6087 RepID=A0ABM4DC72_HYDVU
MDKMKLTLHNAEFISFTTEIWTSISNESFISLIGHCLDNTFNQKTVRLRVAPFPERHTAANIAELIEDYLQLVINECIFKQTVVKNVIANCHSIVRHFSHSSQACHKLKAIQEENNVPKHKLIRNVPTRWNSTYHMLEHIYEQRQPLTVYALVNGKLPSLDANKWIIRQFCVMVKDFHKKAVRLSEKNSIVSDILSQIQFLKHFINKASIDNKFIGLECTLTDLTNSMENRFKQYNDNYNIILSIILDLRFKLKMFKNETPSQPLKQVLRT